MGQRQEKFPHRVTLMILAAGIAFTIYIGLTGHFQIFDANGVLSGPFSALMLISAVLLALTGIVTLDLLVWQPKRDAVARENELWVFQHVLHNESAPPPGDGELRGKFRGRNVTVARTTARGLPALNWSIETSARFNARIVRLEKDETAAGYGNFSTGDDGFDRMYGWQTAQPEKILPYLRNTIFRDCAKRLASLVAMRGDVTEADAGIQIAGKISVTQMPAPALAARTFDPAEVLMILHDLTTLAMLLECSGAPLETETAGPPPAEAPGWAALGCALTLGVSLWLGGTYLLAKLFGLPAGMILFLMAPIAAAILFMMTTGVNTRRDAQIDDTIRAESRKLVRKFPDLLHLSNVYEKRNAAASR